MHDSSAVTASRDSAAGLIARFLKARGVDRVFALCGGHIMLVWMRIDAEGIAIVDVRDERAAVYMAHAYGELTGGLGVDRVVDLGIRAPFHVLGNRRVLSALLNRLEQLQLASRVIGPPSLPVSVVKLEVRPGEIWVELLRLLELLQREIGLAIQLIKDPQVVMRLRLVWHEQPHALELCGSHGLQVDPMEVSYFLSREKLVPGVSGKGMALWRDRMFAAMARNAGSTSDFFNIPANRVVELGTRIEI